MRLGEDGGAHHPGAPRELRATWRLGRHRGALDTRTPPQAQSNCARDGS